MSQVAAALKKAAGAVIDKVTSKKNHKGHGRGRDGAGGNGGGKEEDSDGPTMDGDGKGSGDDPTIDGGAETGDDEKEKKK